MSNNTLAQLRMCAQKYTPTTEAKIQDLCKGKCPLNQQKIRAAFMLNKIWPKNTKVRIAFMDDGLNTPRTTLGQLRRESNYNPDPLQLIADDMTPIELVKRVINERFVPLIDLDISFVDNPKDANIRISFDPNKGAYSYLGSECLQVKYPEATMNLGWIDVGTIIHEVNHGICAMVHEHQNPRGEQIQWNKPKVYAWAETTQGWDKKTTDTNILDAYSLDLVNGSSFDPLSVMLYYYPSDVTTNGKGTRMNLRLSGPDVFWLHYNYPRSDITPSEYYMKVYGETIDDAISKSEYEAARQGPRPFSSNVIIAILIAIIILGIIFVFLGRKKM